VRDEYARNRARVLASAKASQAEVFRRARNALRQFGEAARKDEALRVLDDVAHKVAIHGEASNESMRLVEKLLASFVPIVASVIARQRAANRGLERRAPFHGSKNSTADAVLIETYGELVEEDPDLENRYAFVTANTGDFGAPGGDTRLPHADIALFFDGKRSLYATRLDALLRDPALALPIDEDIEMMFYGEEPRLLSEITEANPARNHRQEPGSVVGAGSSNIARTGAGSFRAAANLDRRNREPPALLVVGTRDGGGNSPGDANPATSWGGRRHPRPRNRSICQGLDDPG
jgi:hypothetical protein